MSEKYNLHFKIYENRKLNKPLQVHFKHRKMPLVSYSAGGRHLISSVYYLFL